MNPFITYKVFNMGVFGSRNNIKYVEISPMEFSWNGSALDFVGDMVLLKPFQPRWMSLYVHHQTPSQCT